MDVSRGSAPRPMWLDADALVREALADHDAGRTMSVPSLRYKAIVLLVRMVPARVLQLFQSLGRR